MYSLAAGVLATAAFVVSLIAAVEGELTGAATLLLLAAGAAAALRVRSRIRAESRHRWALQARVRALETAGREREEQTRQELQDLEDLLAELEHEGRSGVQEAGRDATYPQLALLHDRVLALESARRFQR
ncbi:hypothetical protein DXU92_03410 [Brachybacterium saurashtrense]|uniref:Uncharacterized protein n=1 Tax=Brachybacterium saurashtrense TaxID=556288 RepID=A0A345YQJ8_9MICO|nr:hypothetical protein DWV08_11660 [Brachybacterium saurashtrense]RRR23940.1 hypothetical protein DXU92_03410 [Brachybacterium saurashtrense]